MKLLARNGGRIAPVPVVLEPVGVPVPPALVPIKVEDAAVSVRVALLYGTSSASSSLECSRDCS